MFQLEDLEQARVVTPRAETPTLPEVRLHGEAEPVFGSLREVRARPVIVDLSAVDGFGSAFISVLVRIHKIVRQGGGEMMLAGASERSSEVLQLTGLDGLWPSYADRDKALAALENADADAPAGPTASYA
jgi:anti-anti-sigma factor